VHEYPDPESGCPDGGSQDENMMTRRHPPRLVFWTLDQSGYADWSARNRSMEANDEYSMSRGLMIVTGI
jgi:hypothetical protein